MDNEDSSYTGSFVATHAGDYDILIMYRDSTMAAVLQVNPEITVLPAAAAGTWSTSAGDAFDVTSEQLYYEASAGYEESGVEAGATTSFTVTSRDQYGNLMSACSNFAACAADGAELQGTMTHVTDMNVPAISVSFEDLGDGDYVGTW
eukprot:SAG31_NODE_10925_length_1082_cov_1.886063_1_plen_147_part_01